MRVFPVPSRFFPVHQTVRVVVIRYHKWPTTLNLKSSAVFRRETRSSGPVVYVRERERETRQNNIRNRSFRRVRERHGHECCAVPPPTATIRIRRRIMVVRRINTKPYTHYSGLRNTHYTREKTVKYRRTITAYTMRTEINAYSPRISCKTITCARRTSSSILVCVYIYTYTYLGYEKPRTRRNIAVDVVFKFPVRRESTFLFAKPAGDPYPSSD